MHCVPYDQINNEAIAYVYTKPMNPVDRTVAASHGDFSKLGGSMIGRIVVRERGAHSKSNLWLVK